MGGFGGGQCHTSLIEPKMSPVCLCVFLAVAISYFHSPARDEAEAGQCQQDGKGPGRARGHHLLPALTAPCGDAKRKGHIHGMWPSIRLSASAYRNRQAINTLSNRLAPLWGFYETGVWEM